MGLWPQMAGRCSDLCRDGWGQKGRRGRLTQAFLPLKVITLRQKLVEVEL